MASKKTSRNVKRTEGSLTLQVGGTVSLERIKEIFQKDEQVEFSVVAKRQDRNVALDLARAGSKTDE
jgi:hypothetical protein